MKNQILRDIIKGSLDSIRKIFLNVEVMSTLKIEKYHSLFMAKSFLLPSSSFLPGIVFMFNRINLLLVKSLT